MASARVPTYLQAARERHRAAANLPFARDQPQPQKSAARSGSRHVSARAQLIKEQRASLTRLREQLETRKNTPACELRSVYDVADAAQNIVDHLDNLQTVLGEFSAALMDGDQVAIATAVRIGDNLARCR